MKGKFFSSVIESFMDCLQNTPNVTAIRIVESSTEISELTFADLYTAGCRVSNSFKRLGIRRGDRLVIALPTSLNFFSVYLGALLSGVIPLVVPVHKTCRSIESYAQQLSANAVAIGSNHIVLSENLYEQLKLYSPRTFLDASMLCINDDVSLFDFTKVNESSICHLQSTSGSTGNAKYAVIRHSNIVANVRAIGQAIRHRDNDILLTWLPFFHDMGLIGISYALYWQCPLIATDPSNFVRNPVKFWLELLSRFGATLSPAPNSAFQVCTRLAKRRVYEGMDLSKWRVALCGAEPIYEDTIRRFHEAFSPYGFSEKAMLPVYGLAEATLAVTISDVNTKPLIESIDADLAESEGCCVPSFSDSRRQISVVSVGKVISGHEVRIVDEQGLILGERRIGEIEFAGPSVIDSYWSKLNSSGVLKQVDGFLSTGDFGYVADGQVYVTGRKKDIIIIGGRNFIPSQIEALTEKVINSDILKGTAAFGIRDKGTGTETLHIVIESRFVPRPDELDAEKRIRNSIEEEFGLTGIVIHWVRKGQIPKTTSGKIQRYLCAGLIS